MSDATAIPRHQLDIGEVVRRTLNAVAAELPVALPISIVTLGASELATRWTAAHIVYTSVPLERAMIGFALAVPERMVNSVILAWLTLLALDRLAGAPANRIARLKHCVRRCVPIILTALVVTYATLAATFLLVVPGLILATVWIVATPALLAEALSPRKAIGRSLELTRGHRWQVFSILLLFFAVATALSLLVNEIAAGWNVPVGRLAETPSVAYVTGPLLFALASVVSTAGAAALYQALVQAREGGTDRVMAEVFG